MRSFTLAFYYLLNYYAKFKSVLYLKLLLIIYKMIFLNLRTLTTSFIKL